MRSKMWFVIAVIIISVAAGAQSYPSVVQLAPATAAQPCSVGVAAKNGTIAICPQSGPPNSITIDFGDGKGYINPFVAAGAATVSVGKTTTLAAGVPATVANSGTPQAAVFDFGIPQGAKGDPGGIGPAGPPGVMSASFTCSGPNTISATGAWTLNGCK